VPVTQSISADQHQRCKACGRRDKFDFTVPNETWAAVVPVALRGRVVCLACFDEFAREHNVDYAEQLTELCFAGDRAAFLFLTRSAVNGPFH
jgi:hypothetical protein